MKQYMQAMMGGMGANDGQLPGPQPQPQPEGFTNTAHVGQMQAIEQALKGMEAEQNDMKLEQNLGSWKSTKMKQEMDMYRNLMKKLKGDYSV